MPLESLANELLYELFDYFSSVDLFHSFNGLNARFDHLLVDYFRSNHHFDFRLIPKDDLNIIRRRYLPLFVDRITSLSISNEDTTPHAIDSFLSRLYPLHRFTNLQSITLYNIQSAEKVRRIIDDLHHIPSLTHLRFKQCHMPYDPRILLPVMNNIWRLPNLTHCHLDLIADDEYHPVAPTIVSCSIKHLSVGGFQCDLDDLFYLHEYTPYVQSLSVNLGDSDEEYPQLPLFHSLNTLTLKCNTSFQMIQCLLRKTPNLVDLTIETVSIDVDGQKWQALISKYLPRLEVFNMKMQYIFSDDEDDIEDEIEKIIDPYRSQFWTEQHRWFVRCLSLVQEDQHVIHLHTLPYRFDHLLFESNANFIGKSTCPEDEHYSNYEHVHRLKYDGSVVEGASIPAMQFVNLRHLTLTLPYEDHFQSFVPRLDKLVFLELRMNTQSHDEDDLVQVQSILDQAPRLYYLKFHSWLAPSPSKSEYKNKKRVSTKMPPYDHRSTSVRYLDLQGWDHSGDHQYYNEQQCSALAQSTLGKQCEHLLIEVDKRANVVDLINKMKQLRTLNVRCGDRKSNNDELIKWLQPRLPSTSSFAHDLKSPNDIRLWIR